MFSTNGEKNTSPPSSFSIGTKSYKCKQKIIYSKHFVIHLYILSDQFKDAN